ncbi:hypothetical protein F7725_004103 [Dissostichus mawsoni]|uniref:Uncharacterized protein n=1 Tax=Dissostichus mawsoni TaxID=36200 RepID=A0A7J5YC84_DISMA|nr:hypothetical protein F7725_004103 [Dissostichus mawsoni]
MLSLSLSQGEDRIRTTITNPHHKEPDQNQQRCQTVRPPPPSRPPSPAPVPPSRPTWTNEKGAEGCKDLMEAFAACVLCTESSSSQHSLLHTGLKDENDEDCDEDSDLEMIRAEFGKWWQ